MTAITPEKAQKRLSEILFFQSEPMSWNMLAPWQIDRAKQSLSELFHDVIGEVIEAARVDGMFIEWNGLNLADIKDMRDASIRYFPVDGGGEK